MPANHRLEVVGGRPRKASVGTSEEIRSASRNVRRRKYNVKCVVIFMHAKMSTNYERTCGKGFFQKEQR